MTIWQCCTEMQPGSFTHAVAIEWIIHQLALRQTPVIVALNIQFRLSVCIDQDSLYIDIAEYDIAFNGKPM